MDVSSPSVPALFAPLSSEDLDQLVLSCLSSSSEDECASSPEKPNPLNVMVPEEGKCLSCSSPRGKHLYYGGRTCTSCRAFFRRAVLSSKHVTFACDSGRCCNIDSKSWKSCKRCRFDKCLEAGMQVELVLSEDGKKDPSAKGGARRVRQAPVARRPPPEQPEETTAAALVKPALADSVLFPLVQSVTSHTPRDQLTLEESIFLRSLLSRAHDHIMDISIAHFEQDLPTFERMIGCLEVENYKEHIPYFTLFSDKSRHFYRGLSDVSAFAECDQEVIVQEHYPVLITYFQSVTINSREMVDEVMERFYAHLTEKAKGNSTPHGQMLAILRSHNISPRRRFRVMEYEDRFDLSWAAGTEADARHRSLVQDINRLSLAHPDAELDKTRVMLTMLIALFTDHTGLIQNAAKLDSVRGKYVALLARHLKGKFPEEAEAARQLRLALQMVDMAKEASLIRRSHLMLKSLGQVDLLEEVLGEEREGGI